MYSRMRCSGTSKKNNKQNKQKIKWLQNHPKIKLDEVFSIYTASMI